MCMSYYHLHYIYIYTSYIYIYIISYIIDTVCWQYIDDIGITMVLQPQQVQMQSL